MIFNSFEALHFHANCIKTTQNVFSMKTIKESDCVTYPEELVLHSTGGLFPFSDFGPQKGTFQTAFLPS